MIKILVHHPNESDGTSFYRAFGPFNALERQHPNEFQVTACDMSVSWPLLTKFDIVFMQRPASQWQADFIKMAKAYGVAVWLDWDDHYLDIPDTNNRKEYYTPFNIDLIRWMAREADLVTVSTSHLAKIFSEYNERTDVVRNATDPVLFDLQASNYYKRDNLILWRGSDTHNADFDAFKQQILELMDETPDYVWGFFGYCPDWAIEHLPSHRIKLFANDGVIEYIKTLLVLRPKLLYVPLEDIPFNHSKSNIAWQEATYAGAVVVCPDWKEWKNLPGYHYGGKDDFKIAFHHALRSSAEDVAAAKKHMDRHYNLHTVNNNDRYVLCKRIVEEVRGKRDHMPKTDLPIQFTDQEFFNYNKEHGWTQENPAWVKGMDEMAEYCIEKLGAKAVFDLGCGTGGLLESLIKRDTVCMGIDSNPLNKEFFDKRNPSETERFICAFAQDMIPGNKFDVVVCIEVLEHITDEVNTKILENWRENTNFFIFSSTPYTSSPAFDKQWGHINVKPTEHWIKFFEARGYKMIQRLDFPTKWTLLFVTCPKN